MVTIFFELSIVMLVIFLIFVVGLAPACISAWLCVRSERSLKQSNYRQVPSRPGAGLLKLLDNPSDLHYVDGLGYMIGDITCDLNARSPYLRCAMNPIGPCDGCNTYSPIILDRQV